jgi:O-acetylserine/cysteine efflux transporter
MRPVSPINLSALALSDLRGYGRLVTTDPQHRFGSLDLLVVVMMNLVWGLNLVAVKNSVDQVGPLTAALLRQAIVMVACLPALRIVPGKMRYLLGLGFLSGALFYIVNNFALSVATNISALAIASQLSAPFSLILAIIVLKEKVRVFRIIGMTLSFLGVAVLVFDPDVVKEGLGIVLISMCSMIWAICSLIQRQLIGVRILTIYAWLGCIGTFTLLPIALFFEPEQVRALPQIGAATFGWVLFSALGSTLVGQGAMSWLLQRHPVSTVVPMTLASPVVAVVAGALYFGTPLTPVMIAGGLIALTGVAIVTIRTARVKEQRL